MIKIITLIALILLLLISTSQIENYSVAGITQLIARDPQDAYLTDWGHVYPFYYDVIKPKKSQRLPYF
jgi:hypothetical protein